MLTENFKVEWVQYKQISKNGGNLPFQKAWVYGYLQKQDQLCLIDIDSLRINDTK